MEPLPESILRDVFTSVLSVRDAGRVAICCRRLRRESPDLLMRGLDVPSSFVRYYALRKLQTIEPRKRAQYVGRVVPALGDDVDDVAYEASQLLSSLSPTDLVEHASDIMAMLEHGHADHVLNVVCFLPPPSIAEHATAIAAKLEDRSDKWVRKAALWALFRLDPVPLHSYFATFVEALDDPDEDVRHAAQCCIERYIEGLAPAALIASYNELRLAGDHRSAEVLEEKMDELGIDAWPIDGDY